jgi:Cft2 family RNA processing exonuclease
LVDLECIPYAVGHADEGVSLLVRMGPHRILLDCGLRQIDVLLEPVIWDGDRPHTSPEPAHHLAFIHPDLPADLALCSHAHPDHARGLLALHQAFPRLPIYGSEVTTHLLPLNWPAAEVPLFCQALPWRSPVELAEGLVAELFPAGHLPGAAAFLLTYRPPPQAGESESRPYTLMYTGDFFLSNSRLVEGFPLEELRGLAPDVLIVEGSFGTARHAHRRQQENQLAEKISQAIKQGISVMLPVPVLGLGQELLMLLRSHHYFTGQNLDIWVEEAIAIGCDAYLDILPQLPANVRNFAQNQPLFWDQRIRPRVQRLRSEQRASLGQPACVVLVDQNVDVQTYCQNSNWLILLPRQIASVEAPALLEKIQAVAQVKPEQFSVETYVLAEHSDGPATTQLIHNLRPQHVVFVHGSTSYLADLTGLDELSNRYHLHCPAAGTRVELPIADAFQPNQLETSTSYEGEVAELGSVVTVTLPQAITDDPRWRNFADTGLVVGSWQGEDLVIRGLSAQDILLDRPSSVTAIDCCATCLYYRGQRCWNQTSALFGFKVSPEGYCPVYEPLNFEPGSDFER